ncbi:hypothetical protein T4D_7257 [Trichinella pseudospiralis]|uniref:Uncharacterized protein n=1 Tax=Trichinella pseudospiralis TaxID=6337 RepID=A0A0V1FNQ1_TRIPS|nr:hypothetical protein T4D_7257 [Trichinella pseudospiralis]
MARNLDAIRDGPTDLARREDKPEASDQNEPLERRRRPAKSARASAEAAVTQLAPTGRPDGGPA